MGKLPAVVIAGGVAGLIGAAVWAAVAYYANLEIGWIAWAVGGLVGFAVAAAGGSGGAGGLIATLITIVAICGGKVAAVNFALDKFKSTDLEAEFSVVKYNEAKQEAAQFVQLTSRDQYPKFMVDAHYTDAKRPEDVTADEIELFATQNAPMIKLFHEDPPDYEMWKKTGMAMAGYYLDTQVSLWDKLKNSLSAFDLLFFALALGTAYRLGYGGVEA